MKQCELYGFMYLDVTTEPTKKSGDLEQVMRLWYFEERRGSGRRTVDKYDRIKACAASPGGLRTCAEDLAEKWYEVTVGAGVDLDQEVKERRERMVEKGLGIEEERRREDM